MKYDIEGNLRWLSLYVGPLGGASTPFDLALAPDGSVVVTGESYGGSATRRDVATVKYVQLPPDPDLDGDGTVGFSDLLIMLAAWGECDEPPAACQADIDDDGVVGFSDLLIVLAAWSG